MSASMRFPRSPILLAPVLLEEGDMGLQCAGQESPVEKTFRRYVQDLHRNDMLRMTTKRSPGLWRRLAPVHLVALALSILMVGPAVAQVGSGPIAAPLRPALPTPLDRPFQGKIELAVDATDTDHQIFSVHETIPVQAPGDAVLLYPEWETASHAPTATVVELAGLVVHVDGKASDWMRDPVDMHAFHVEVPKGARSISLDFQFLAPAAAHLLRPDMVIVPWQRVLLYPAGWYVRDIPVAATLMLPPGLTPYASLAFHASNDGTLGPSDSAKMRRASSS
jgi:hypothetical protein